MARGMVVGEAVVSQAATEEFREGYARTFFTGTCRCGHDSHTHEQTRAGRCFADEGAPDACGCQKFSRAPQRGRWVWDAGLGRLVSAEEYVPPSRAVDAPVMAGRFYENVATIDGVDIGSRAKHRAYMRDRGLAPADDFSPAYYEGERKKAADQAKRERRETLERAFYEISNKRQ